MPLVDGSKPEKRLARLGPQMGAWQWALVNSVPRDAKRSMFGVRASGCPPMQPTQSFRSSIAINSTLGADAVDCRSPLGVSAAAVPMQPNNQAAASQLRGERGKRAFMGGDPRSSCGSNQVLVITFGLSATLTHT